MGNQKKSLLLGKGVLSRVDVIVLTIYYNYSGRGRFVGTLGRKKEVSKVLEQ